MNTLSVKAETFINGAFILVNMREISHLVYGPKTSVPCSNGRCQNRSSNVRGAASGRCISQMCDYTTWKHLEMLFLDFFEQINGNLSRFHIKTMDSTGEVCTLASKTKLSFVCGTEFLHKENANFVYCHPHVFHYVGWVPTERSFKFQEIGGSLFYGSDVFLGDLQ